MNYDYMVGESEISSQPIDAVSDENLQRVLKEGELSPLAVDDVMANRGKFRVLLSEIYEAGLAADFGKVRILSKTLEVALGRRDPRMKDDDPIDEYHITCASRPWYNG